MVDTKVKSYRSSLLSLYQDIDRLKKNVTLCQEGKTPPSLTRKSGVQFKKDQEEYKQEQINADKEVSMKDFVRSLAAQKKSVQDQQQKLGPHVFIADFFGELYDKLLKTREAHT
eukprot:6384776-Karenia_brevis.AAC.1